MLSALDAVQGRFFAAWCAEFLVRENRSKILLDHSVKEAEEIDGYASEIWNSASGGAAFTTCRANEIKARLLAVGPEDEVARIEVDNAATEALSCLWNAVEAQVDPSVELVALVSENLVNALDYIELNRPGDPYSLENMFEFPRMAEELRIQCEFIDNLKAGRPNSLVSRSVALGGRGSTGGNTT